MIEVVLWDLDGVLVDSERLVKAAFLRVMSEAGYTENMDAFHAKTIGLNPDSIVALYQQLTGSQAQAKALYLNIAQQSQADITQHLELKAGVMEALTYVHKLGLSQMVVTSSDGLIARKKLAMFSLDHFMAGVISGDQVDHGKPHPEPYTKACAQLNVHPSKALVVEDSENGVRAGLAAGAQVVHVPDLILLDRMLLDQVEVLESLEGLPDWMAQQNKQNWL